MWNILLGPDGEFRNSEPTESNSGYLQDYWSRKRKVNG